MKWQDQARNLGFGEKRKVSHCSHDQSAYISNSPKGVSLYCFRCGAKEFEGHGRLSARDILEMRKRDEKEAKQVSPRSVKLYDNDVPNAARVWVLRAGITPERATDTYGISWSERTCRVIIPIHHNGKPTGQWIGRSIDGRKPKYLMPKGSTGASWYRLLGDRTPCIVVEDILSAIRVSEAGYSALAVLGTTVRTEHAALLSDRPVIGWFDGDDAGRKGFIKLKQSLSPFGVEPLRIKTEFDPKLYSKRIIAEEVEKVRNMK